MSEWKETTLDKLIREATIKAVAAQDKADMEQLKRIAKKVLTGK